MLQQRTDELLIQLPGGEQRFIALSWTDQAVTPVTQPGAYFLLDQLVNLRKRLDAIYQDRRHSGTIPPEREQQLEGGAHGKSSAVQSDPIIRRTTSSGDRPISADDPASTEQDSGGGESE